MTITPACVLLLDFTRERHGSRTSIFSLSLLPQPRPLPPSLPPSLTPLRCRRCDFAVFEHKKAFDPDCRFQVAAPWAAQIGNLLPVPENLANDVPLLLFGFTAVVAGVSAMLALPETRGKAQPMAWRITRTRSGAGMLSVWCACKNNSTVGG